jgi:hypothetical protein
VQIIYLPLDDGWIVRIENVHMCTNYRCASGCHIVGICSFIYEIASRRPRKQGRRGSILWEPEVVGRKRCTVCIDHVFNYEAFFLFGTSHNGMCFRCMLRSTVSIALLSRDCFIPYA